VCSSDLYGIDIPEVVKQQLEAGGLETPKPGDARLARCETHLIATPQQSLEAAADAARALGLRRETRRHFVRVRLDLEVHQ
jgi:hydroxypyruvate reductase